jgi:uncharacterized iron-regulated membrane protein
VGIFPEALNDGAKSMFGIAVFLGLVAVAAGFALWNDRRSPGWHGPRERKEPRIPVTRL